MGLDAGDRQAVPLVVVEVRGQVVDQAPEKGGHGCRRGRRVDQVPLARRHPLELPDQFRSRDVHGVPAAAHDGVEKLEKQRDEQRGTAAEHEPAGNRELAAGGQRLLGWARRLHQVETRLVAEHDHPRLVDPADQVGFQCLRPFDSAADQRVLLLVRRQAIEFRPHPLDRLAEGLRLGLLHLQLVGHLLQPGLHLLALRVRGVGVLRRPVFVAVLDHLLQHADPLLELDHLRVLGGVPAQRLLQLPLVLAEALLEWAAVYGRDHHHLGLLGDEPLQAGLSRPDRVDFRHLGVVLGLQLGELLYEHLDLGVEVRGLGVRLEPLHVGVEGAPGHSRLVELGAVVLVGVLGVLAAHGAASIDQHRSDLVGDGGGRLGVFPGHLDLEHARILPGGHVDGRRERAAQDRHPRRSHHGVEVGGQLHRVQHRLEVVLLGVERRAASEGELVLVGPLDQHGRGLPLSVQEGEGEKGGEENEGAGYADDQPAPCPEPPQEAPYVEWRPSLFLLVDAAQVGKRGEGRRFFAPVPFGLVSGSGLVQAPGGLTVPVRRLVPSQGVAALDAAPGAACADADLLGHNGSEPASNRAP